MEQSQNIQRYAIRTRNTINLNGRIIELDDDIFDEDVSDSENDTESIETQDDNSNNYKTDFYGKVYNVLIKKRHLTRKR